jgi:hypothetical protein
MKCTIIARHPHTHAHAPPPHASRAKNPVSYHDTLCTNIRATTAHPPQEHWESGTTVPVSGACTHLFSSASAVAKPNS